MGKGNLAKRSLKIAKPVRTICKASFGVEGPFKLILDKDVSHMFQANTGALGSDEDDKRYDNGDDDQAATL